MPWLNISVTPGDFPKETWLTPSSEAAEQLAQLAFCFSRRLQVCRRYRWAVLFRKKPWRKEACIVSPICPSKRGDRHRDSLTVSHSHFLGRQCNRLLRLRDQLGVFTGRAFLDRWFCLLAAKRTGALAFSLRSPCPWKGLSGVMVPSLLPILGL